MIDQEYPHMLHAALRSMHSVHSIVRRIHPSGSLAFLPLFPFRIRSRRAHASAAKGVYLTAQIEKQVKEWLLHFCNTC